MESGLPPRQWRGVVLALAVAVSFAANSTFAGLAYTGGADALSVFAARSTAAYVVLLLYLVLTGRPRKLPSRQRNIALVLGVIMAWASYALLSAMERMPVALCVITLYTYPLLIASFGWWSGRERFRARFAVALAAAFTGLVFALDLSGNAPSIDGLLLAASGAVSVAILLLVSERARAPLDAQPFTLYMLATCMVVAVLICVAEGEFALPHTQDAWLGFIATPLCYSFSIICMFIAVSMIGSLRTSLVMNLEPVSSVLLGYVLLSQALDGLQLLGVALVIAAIVFIEGGHAAATKLGAGTLRSPVDTR